MLDEGHMADGHSLSGVLNPAADLAALHQGEAIHSMAVKSGHERNPCVRGSLVDMYSKSGEPEAAHRVFRGTPDHHDLESWNSMMGGFASHGDAGKVFEMFDEMAKRGFEPDRVTYILLLSACSHRGLVDMGRFYWFSLACDGLVPGIEHYTCMVSLLCRARRLQEAEDLIRGSPIGRSSPDLWRILLNSCVIYRELDMGVHAAEQVLAMDPHDSSCHILLSNLYASVGRWEGVAGVRKKARELQLGKEPGLSWICVSGVSNLFASSDESHPQVGDCRDLLLQLQRNLRGFEGD